MNILIVDDNSANRELLKEMLEREGYGIVEAQNGKEALRRLKEEKADLIISDILMPEMDGFHFCYEIRKSKEFHCLPFIMYSLSFLSRNDEQWALEYGADKFIAKSAPFQLVLNSIQELATDPRYHRPRKVHPPEEMKVMKEYNEVLIRKLEQKNAELLHVAKTLTAQKNFLRTMINAMPDCVLLVAQDGKIMDVNRAGLKLLEADHPDQVVGKSMDAFLTEAYREVFWKSAEKVFSGGRAHLEYEMYSIKRSPRFLKTYAVPIHDPENGVKTLLAISQDISDLRKAEEMISESEERFRLLLDSTAEAIFGLDLEGKCMWANSACLRILGYDDIHALLGRHMHSLIHHSRPDGEPNPVEECRIDLAFRQGEKTHVDNDVFWRADGTSFPVEYWSYPICREEKIVGAVVTFLDITERRSLEEQLIQAQKMEAIGRLAGGVAHDFNNLLTGITGYSDLLARQIPVGSSASSDLLEIRKAAERASGLTNQLLAFARRQMVQPVVVNLNQLIFELDKMLRRLIGEHIQLVSIPGRDTSKVKVDPSQLEQVLINLAVNARDAMPKGGKLVLETSHVTLDQNYVRCQPGLVSGRYVMIAVSDTGAGMTNEVKAHLFEPFYTTKEKGKGVGLGLATCYGIIKQAGGFISVYSELGRGTTFKIYLPEVEEMAESRTKTEGPEIMPRGNETILLVEDEPLVRELALRVLQEQGYRVLTAQNGAHALRIAEEHQAEKIHLLLSDLVMPQMGGKELADQIKTKYPEIKILFTSGYTDEAIVHHGLHNPGIAFLGKPFTMQTLACKVREVLDEKCKQQKAA